MENMVMGIVFGTSVANFRNSYIKGFKGTFCHIKMCDIESVKKSILEEIAKMETEHKELQLAINKEEKNRVQINSWKLEAGFRL